MCLFVFFSTDYDTLTTSPHLALTIRALSYTEEMLNMSSLSETDTSASCTPPLTRNTPPFVNRSPFMTYTPPLVRKTPPFFIKSPPFVSQSAHRGRPQSLSGNRRSFHNTPPCVMYPRTQEKANSVERMSSVETAKEIIHSKNRSSILKPYKSASNSPISAVNTVESIKNQNGQYKDEECNTTHAISDNTQLLGATASQTNTVDLLNDVEGAHNTGSAHVHTEHCIIDDNDGDLTWRPVTFVGTDVSGLVRRVRQINVTSETCV